MTVILKHFKACIFPTVCPIFIKFLPSIMVGKKPSANFESYINVLWTFPFNGCLLELSKIQENDLNVQKSLIIEIL